MGAEFITARYGERVLYIEKSGIETVLKAPRIWKVPGAPEEISGIARYEGMTAVFYKAAEAEDAACGILMKDGTGGLFGFAVKEVGEELSAAHKDAGELDEKNFRQVMPGVWEENSDTSE